MNALVSKFKKTAPGQVSGKAFSLIEVVVAVGIFAVSIVAVIGLLSPISRSVSEVKEADDATRVINAIQTTLQNLATQSGGWDFITGKTDPSKSYIRTAVQVQTDDADTSFDPSTKNYILFASRNGERVARFNGTLMDADTINVWNPGNAFPLPADQNAQKYFEIVLIRNGDYPSTGDGLSPKANDDTAGFLAFTIRLRWPAYAANGDRFELNSQKSVLLVPAAIHR